MKMPKFNFGNLKAVGKEIGKSAASDAANVALLLVGAVSSKKFFDFRTVFKNLPEDHWAIKHQGIIKFGVGLAALMFFSKKIPAWGKMLIYGLMFEGGLTAARQYTKDQEGKSFFEQLGQGKEIPITEQYPP